ncbi:Phosphoserine phosphatase RsbU [Aquisphaera giovannonii]|uniref:Phosphoserine phosphatase RsbU n=1 Tax=Aquisphaera giovannonii TaxID=406548 RepID=A0A5B9W0V4_9BACT|nr:SpoIIE family protein phosphatase [Aquisphaera giovannonii]QEH33899.1 Phosphoserine phosphatase RsbU [Aquisphaera giovannonii]
MISDQSIVPTLQILSGPHAGRLYKIDRDVLVIGRNTDCDLILEPKSVSRRHAAVVRREADYVIKDLNSTRGTFVNGVRLAQPAVLKNGNVIQIGELQLYFKTNAVQIQDDSSEPSTVFATMDMPREDARFEAVVRPEEKLRALHRIGRSLGATLELSAVLDKVLAALFEIFPAAERGFVLLEDRTRGILTPEAIRTRSGTPGNPKISKSILQRVLNDGKAILSKDLPSEFPNSESVSEGRITSLMCVPLLDHQQHPIGIIQIDTRTGRTHFEQDDLDLLVSVAGQVSVAVQNARLHHDLIKQHELEQELQYAREVMQALLPERPKSVSGYEFWDHYEPARHVGGDYYGFIPLYGPRDDRKQPARRWAIAIGDVVGKGLPAALLTARLSAEIRLFLQGEGDPAWVVSRLNQQLIENGVLDMYITFLLIILDVETSRIQLANAGHPHPLLRRTDGQVVELGKEASGLPLAIAPDGPYESWEATLQPGESVVLFTDGVTDAMDQTNGRFGDKRLRQIIAATPGGPTPIGETILHQVQEHSSGRTQFDDITIVTFGRRPAAGG